MESKIRNQKSTIGMSPGKTVSKLRSAPAPYLAPAPAPKLGVGVALNRCRDRVSCLLGPDTVLTRSRPDRDAVPTSPRCGRYLTEGRIVSRRDRGSPSVRCAVDASRGMVNHEGASGTHPTRLDGEQAGHPGGKRRPPGGGWHCCVSSVRWQSTAHRAVAPGHPSRVERIGMVSPDSSRFFVPRFLCPPILRE